MEHFLNKLPLEVLLFILKHFLDLPDLWTLSQVSHTLKLHSLETIKKQWKIEINSSTSIIRIQAHAAMISLHLVARQLIQRIKIYDPYAFPPTLPPLQQILEFNEEQAHIIYDLGIQQQQQLPRGFSPGLLTLEEDRFEDNATFPPTTEPGLDDIGNENIFLLERLKYHSKRLHCILRSEQDLHTSITNGLIDQQDHHHKNYHYDDDSHSIHVRLRIFMDVLFQHAVIVGAISCQRGSYKKLLACTNSSSQITHAFAAVCSRLLCKLVTSFPNCDHIISTCLFENMNTYLAYFEYRLLAATAAVASTSNNKQQEITTTIGISCCVDLLGATYCSNIVKEDHASFIVRKLCQILSGDNDTVKKKKKVILFDLMDVWLKINHRANDEIGQLVQLEIK
jgi:hypothetical protein